MILDSLVSVENLQFQVDVLADDKAMMLFGQAGCAWDAR